MKRLFLIGIAMVLAISLSAQKAKVTSAWNFLKDGYLDDAKKAIEQAEQNPQTAESYKTFLYKGQIYQELGNTKNKKYQALCTNCYETAYESYMKALKYNFVKPEYRDIDFTTQEGLMKFASILNKNNEADYESTEAIMDILYQRFPALSNAFVNKGIAAFQSGDFENSYNQFAKAIEISTLTFRIDTQIYYYTSLAAMRSKKFEEAISLNDFLIKAGYGIDNKEKVTVYQNQAMAYKETGDTEKMLKVLEDGIAKYPNDNYPLVIETFNYYVAAGNQEEAKNYINMAIESDPNNAQFLVIRGTLSQELKKPAEAEADFTKALEIDPNNYDAVYGMGALCINTAADTLEWANKNIPPQNFDEYAKYEELAKGYQAKALPYLEKARTIKPNDLQVLQALKELYYKTGKFEESQAVGEEIKKLTE